MIRRRVEFTLVYDGSPEWIATVLEGNLGLFKKLPIAPLTGQRVVMAEAEIKRELISDTVYDDIAPNGWFPDEAKEIVGG